jgi:hypothetical protein
LGWSGSDAGNTAAGRRLTTCARRQRRQSAPEDGPSGWLPLLGSQGGCKLLSARV